MNLKIPCTSCSDWQPSRMCLSIARFITVLLMLLLAKVKVDVFRVWPLACRWLALAVFCIGHGPLQFPAEVWRASRAFYTQAHNWPQLPTCTYWQWQKYAPLGKHIHIQEHTYAHKIICIHRHRPTLNTCIVIVLSFVLDTMILESTLALFSFTFCLHWTEYTHKLERKKEDMKLKHTKVILSSPFCVCFLSLSPYYFFLFSSTTALHKHKKGSCSAISAIQATRDQGSNQKKKSGLNKKYKKHEEVMAEGSNRKP